MVLGDQPFGSRQRAPRRPRAVAYHIRTPRQVEGPFARRRHDRPRLRFAPRAVAPADNRGASRPRAGGDCFRNPGGDFGDPGNWRERGAIARPGARLVTPSQSSKTRETDCREVRCYPAPWSSGRDCPFHRPSHLLAVTITLGWQRTQYQITAWNDSGGNVQRPRRVLPSINSTTAFGPLQSRRDLFRRYEVPDGPL